MNYITKAFNKKLAYLEQAAEPHELANHYRVKIEYGLIVLLGYLWNKNYSRLQPEAMEVVAGRLLQPTLGALLEITRTLDIDSEVFGIKELSKAINKYPQLRNEKIGHGYVFQDGLEDLIAALSGLASTIFTAPDSLLSVDCDLILVQKEVNSIYSGINFASDGDNYHVWRCPKALREFEIGSTYCHVNGQYHKLSPFIEIDDKQQFFVFRDVHDRLTGKVRYNQLLQTGTKSREWPTFVSSVPDGDTRLRTPNGTVVNMFRPNYRKYASSAESVGRIRFWQAA